MVAIKFQDWMILYCAKIQGRSILTNVELRDYWRKGYSTRAVAQINYQQAHEYSEVYGSEEIAA